MEVAHVRSTEPELTASGTQLGASYELRYWLEPKTLRLDLVGERQLELNLGEADFFDLGFSPLFNSLPVLRDGLLQGSSARTYRMSWIDVPTLEIHVSEQRYEPLGGGMIQFSSGSFTSDIRFDEAGFVLSYPGIATRVGRDEA